MSKKEILLLGHNDELVEDIASILFGDGWHLSYATALTQSDLPDKDSLDVIILLASSAIDQSKLMLTGILKQMPGIPVVVISPEANRQQVVALISAGAADYLVSPADPEVLISKVNQLRSIASTDGFIAHSPSTLHTVQLARRAAATNAAILIGGESGTGKEVLAQFIHRSSLRCNEPFIAVNCAAIPETMLESILFGHERGAFTGASSRHAGKFEQASGGTLFLDEIAEMPLEQQAKLLRVLQEKEVERLGGAKPLKIDVRIISATNKDLAEQVRLGLFREDLYYRLNVFPMHLHSLRERSEDIVPLARFFLKRSCNRIGQPAPDLSPEAISALQSYDWPGNIRELENVIQRADILKRGWVILPEDLMLPGYSQEQSVTGETRVVGIRHFLNRSGRASADSKYPGPARKQQEWQHVLEVLKKHGGHRSRSAEELGMTTRMLRYKLAQLREAGMDVDSIIANAAMLPKVVD